MRLDRSTIPPDRSRLLRAGCRLAYCRRGFGFRRLRSWKMSWWMRFRIVVDGGSGGQRYCGGGHDQKTRVPQARAGGGTGRRNSQRTRLQRRI